MALHPAGRCGGALHLSDEQIKNLGIITRLYDGNTDEFYALIKEYKKKALGENKDYFEEQIKWLEERFPGGKYRDVTGLCKVVEIGEIFDKDGSVVGIIEDSIADQDWSLNAGRYVGVVIEDDGLTEDEFKEQIKGLHDDFNSLNSQAEKLEKAISTNLKKLFGE